MVDQTIMKSVQDYLKAVQHEGIAVRFGVIFGSYTKGLSNNLSDIDVLVVSPVFDSPRRRKDIDLLWRLAARSDSRIEPVPCGERQWDEDSSSQIVEIARREGERITISDAS
jgi:uncharacterized protein